tara:strand:+ start:52 stop:1344 length:1293 start_codon:yes stop_codon:yes gene_type:complete
MNKIFRFNQSLSIKMPFLITFIVMPIISLMVLKFAGNFDSPIFGIMLSRVEKQFIWIVLGILIFFVLQFLRLRFLNEKIYLLYTITVILLILPFFADAVKGANNWIFGFQPSEFGKIIIVVALAKFLSDNKKNINNVYFIVVSSFIILIPTMIFFVQKDIGTALVYFSIFIPMLYWIGLKPTYCFLIFSPIASGYINMTFNVYNHYDIKSMIPTIILFVWMIINFIFLKKHYKTFLNISVLIFSIIFINTFSTVLSHYSWEYMKNSNNKLSYVKSRIENFIIPTLNPKAGGYQVAQSKVAVGSGGFFGVGLGLGTQVELQYLPEADTDFIISSIGEAFGFLFIFIIILVYLNLFYWLLDYAHKARNDFLSLLIIGYSSMLFFHSIITLGMAVAIAPVTGLPAPFLSYGGTFTLSCFIMLGICNNIANKNI